MNQNSQIKIPVLWSSQQLPQITWRANNEPSACGCEVQTRARAIASHYYVSIVASRFHWQKMSLMFLMSLRIL